MFLGQRLKLCTLSLLGSLLSRWVLQKKKIEIELNSVATSEKNNCINESILVSHNADTILKLQHSDRCYHTAQAAASCRDATTCWLQRIRAQTLPNLHNLNCLLRQGVKVRSNQEGKRWQWTLKTSYLYHSSDWHVIRWNSRTYFLTSFIYCETMRKLRNSDSFSSMLASGFCPQTLPAHCYQ